MLMFDSTSEAAIRPPEPFSGVLESLTFEVEVMFTSPPRR